MAAVQVQQSQRSLEAIRNYADIVRRAFGEAAPLIAADADGSANSLVRRPGLVVFCSEHGFCGAFNEPLITTAAQESSKEPNLRLIFVGSRGGQRAAERALPPGQTIPMATHSDGVTGVARRVTSELYRMFVEQAITSIEVIFTREVSGHHTTLHREKLLPLKASVAEENRAMMLPIVNMNPRRLLDELAAEYMFALWRLLRWSRSRVKTQRVSEQWRARMKISVTKPRNSVASRAGCVKRQLPPKYWTL